MICMTVKELINKLEEFDGEVVKCINYEFNFNTKSWIKVCE